MVSVDIILKQFNILNLLLPCSSAVEQIPVKNKVVGSNPTGGAKDLINTQNFIRT